MTPYCCCALMVNVPTSQAKFLYLGEPVIPSGRTDVNSSCVDENSADFGFGECLNLNILQIYLVLFCSLSEA